MSAWTPGPWRVSSGGPQGRGECIVYGSDGYAVGEATVYHGKRPADSPHNARLIASAPELYAVVRDVVWHLTEGGGALHASALAEDSETETVLERYRAALARAEGTETE